jgi:hypothetical protein
VEGDGMGRYRREDLEALSEVDELSLLRFRGLRPTVQWQILDLIRSTAKDPKLAQQDRQIAEARYRQFRGAAKKRPGRKKRR